MGHGPCGKTWGKSPCMYNADGELTDVCHKSFPKEFVSETKYDENNSYVKYRRKAPRDGGNEALRNGIEIDSRWIVPYSPYLMLKYNCHINVEACASNKATKYLHKYVTKGGDRAMLGIDERGMTRNEVQEYQDLKSIGFSESCWRLFEFDMTER